jgi:hypothetical protein
MTQGYIRRRDTVVAEASSFAQPPDIRQAKTASA